MTDITMRKAGASDVETMMRLLVASADSQGERQSLCVNAADLLREGFGETPAYHAILAETQGRVVGLALYSFNFSTWSSVKGLFLEDLYVEPEWRRHGVARRLMQELVEIARENHCGRFQWFVLRSNAGARRFYESIGANALDGWLFMHLDVGKSR